MTDSERLPSVGADIEAEPRYAQGTGHLDCCGRFTHVTPSLCGVLGRTSEALVGEPFLANCPAEERTRLHGRLYAAIEGLGSTTTHVVLDGDGKPLIVETRIEPIRDHGSIVGLRIVCRRKAAPDRSSRRAPGLQRALCQFQDMVMITTAGPLDGTGPQIVYVNAAFERLTGYRAEEVIGHTPRILQGPGTDRRELDRVRAALQRHEPVAAEVINYRKCGEPFWMQTRISPVFDRHGQCTHFMAIERDVSSEHDQRMRHQLAAIALDKTAEGVMVLDEHGHITLVNGAFSAITGYAPRSVIGRVPLLDPRHNRPRLFSDIRKRLASDAYWQGEVWVQRRDGQPFPAFAYITRGEDADAGAIHYVVAFQNMTERRETEARLRRVAHNDPLTDLPTRQWIEDRTALLLQRAEHRGRRLALLFLDMDHFRQISESLGQGTGEELLRKAALRLSGTNPDCALARLSGDDFVLVDDSIGDEAGAATLAQRVLDAFRQPLEVAGGSIYAGISIGIACFPEDGDTFATLLHRAELGMYRAKQQGRNQYRFYARESPALAARSLTLQTALGEALNRQELRLYYRPAIDIRSGRIAGAEAETRWMTAGGGMLGPAEFMPAVEQTGFGETILEWTLNEAVNNLAQCPPAFRLTVPVSHRLLLQPLWVSRLTELIRPRGIAPSQLRLRLPEASLSRHLDALRPVLGTLREAGFGVVVAGFGTGHSSITQIDCMWASHVMIDAKVTAELPDCPRHRRLARAIIQLGASLDMGVVVDGIANPLQFDTIRRWGADEAQGNLCGLAHPAGDLSWVATHAPTPALVGASRTGSDREPCGDALAAVAGDNALPGCTLFVAGSAPSGHVARAAVRDLLETVGLQAADCRVVDVLTQPQRASSAGIATVPTLVVSRGGRRRHFVGDLNSDSVRDALRAFVGGRRT